MRGRVREERGPFPCGVAVDLGFPLPRPSRGRDTRGPCSCKRGERAGSTDGAWHRAPHVLQGFFLEAAASPCRGAEWLSPDHSRSRPLSVISSRVRLERVGFSLPGLWGRSITRVSIPEAVRLGQRDDRQWFFLLSKGSLVRRGAAPSAVAHGEEATWDWVEQEGAWGTRLAGGPRG